MEKKRDRYIQIRLSENELSMIKSKMAQAGFRRISGYIRKMAMDGYIIVIDLNDVKEAIRLLRINANNLNQYAKRANETGNIYLEDIKDLQKSQEELWQVMRDILDRLSSIK